MTEQHAAAKGAHLVGSVPLANSDEVFETSGDLLGRHLRRMSDGETGSRSDWIRWQHRVFLECPQLEPKHSNDDDYRKVSLIKIKDDCTAEDIELPDLGYSAVALQSWERFQNARQAGRIPAHCRFQVSLPTPLAPIQFYVTRSDQAALEPIYEGKLLAELENILESIPNHELAIQWDTAVEFAVLENVLPTFMDNPEPQILERLVRLGNAVPVDTELGYHLCYGDSGHKHFTEPEDASILARVANHLGENLARTLNWIHMPVPRDRHDVDYFQPLSTMKLQAETELYLGLVHITDGLEGTRQRIAAAAKVIGEFGVATECGFGRRPAETVLELMKIHADAAAPLG